MTDIEHIDALAAAGVRQQTMCLQTSSRLMMSDQQILDVWERVLEQAAAIQTLAGCELATMRAALEAVRADPWASLDRILADGPIRGAATLG
jgi:hypothetical protein